MTEEETEDLDPKELLRLRGASSELWPRLAVPIRRLSHSEYQAMLERAQAPVQFAPEAQIRRRVYNDGQNQRRMDR